MDPTKTKLLRKEYAKALKKLPESAKKEILEILNTLTPAEINEATIEEIKQIVSKHLAGDKAEEVIAYYTQQFWNRGADFANRKLKHYGISIEIPPHLGILDNETLLQLENLQLDLIKGLSEETKKALAFQLREGIIRGESITKLTERVKEVINDTKWKAERIARTESTRVFNAAAIDRYQKAGLKKWKWYAAVDERTCPICGAKHDKIFSVGDPTPPAHPNCRCTVIPYFEKDGDTEQKEELGTGIPEIDEKIGKALNDFEKALKEEGSFTSAVNRLVNGGKTIDLNEAQEIFKRIYGKHIKGASKELKEHLRLKLATRINLRVIEKTDLVQIKNRVVARSYYNPIRKEIVLSKVPEKQWNLFLHEYGHHLEHELYRDKVAEFYLARIRKKGYKLVHAKKFYKHAGEDEYLFLGFEHLEPYAGKFYGGNYEHEHFKVLRAVLNNPKSIEEFKDQITTEVLSVGLQMFENERTIKDLYEKDKELFGFILALMRGDFI